MPALPLALSEWAAAAGEAAGRNEHAVLALPAAAMPAATPLGSCHLQGPAGRESLQNFVHFRAQHGRSGCAASCASVAMQSRG